MILICEVVFIGIAEMKSSFRGERGSLEYSSWEKVLGYSSVC
jgi:hypothetical protein